MTHRLVRSRTAELVAEVIGSRYGRKFLESYQWSTGIPIVITQCSEPLEDVMALVSVHETPVYVALLRPDPERLCLMRVTLGTGALQVVEQATGEETIGELYDRTCQRAFEVFRVRYWRFSAVAHAVPELAVSDLQAPWTPPLSTKPSL